MTDARLAGKTEPYPFTQANLGPEVLDRGAEAILSDFYAWRDQNPDLIAEHVEAHTAQLGGILNEQGLAAQAGRFFSPGRRRAHRRLELVREIGGFGVYNLGEVPAPEVAGAFKETMQSTFGRTFDLLRSQQTNSGTSGLVTSLKRGLPMLEPSRIEWFGDQLDRLYHMLPEAVIKGGGMGKTVRTATGVLLIGAYDTLYEEPAVKKEHLARILPAAYAFGALYSIVDDTLQDGGHASAKDRQRYDELILQGLRTGKAIDTSKLPDHPLGEELQRIYKMFLETFPFGEYPHLYRAGEAMYLAQDRDARKTPEDVALHGLAHLYPDILIKASMSRIIANILGRRALDDSYYRRSIGINLNNQLGDDLQDRVQDRKEGRVTTFSFEGGSDTEPLYDLFAYSAYTVARNFDSDPVAAELLARFRARRLAAHFSSRPEEVEAMYASYAVVPEISQFLQAAVGLSRWHVNNLERKDLQLKSMVDKLFRDRQQTNIDPRTFISDRLDYINGVIDTFAHTDKQDRLDEIVGYSLAAGGKRLRPALALMVAEGLQVDYHTLEPLLAASELFHTTSLVFDDLPAQDNATMRRGKPTAHLAFDEAGAQLAGISMISTAFGVLAKLADRYPAERITEVVEYFGSVLGSDRLCRGQDMDLQMGKSSEAATGEDIIKMYELKTSAMMEAAMAPVLMLANRPDEELRLIKDFARHAGIVFQAQDDILDATATSETLEKDANADVDKVNLVRAFGLPETRRIIQQHLEAATQCCRALPFNTELLQRMVAHFATRNR